MLACVCGVVACSFRMLDGCFVVTRPDQLGRCQVICCCMLQMFACLLVMLLKCLCS